MTKKEAIAWLFENLHPTIVDGCASYRLENSLIDTPKEKCLVCAENQIKLKDVKKVLGI